MGFLKNYLNLKEKDAIKKRLYLKVQKSEFGLYLFRDDYKEEYRDKDYEINYIGNRILPLVNNYSSHIKTYKRLSFTAAIASSLIPITTLLVNMSKDSDWLIITLLLIAFLGSAGAAINTYLSTHNYKSDGIIKDNQAMLLKSEVHKYYTYINGKPNDEEAYYLFCELVNKCEVIINNIDIYNNLLNEKSELLAVKELESSIDDSRG